uniref:Uncharacterized protein n=1 Tax=Ixodes ricinus TaxID=34613 RepID=A0A6B0UCE6_IXORI
MFSPSLLKTLITWLAEPQAKASKAGCTAMAVTSMLVAKVRVEHVWPRSQKRTSPVTQPLVMRRSRTLRCTSTIQLLCSRRVMMRQSAGGSLRS